tara:strand:+ start:2795 stop:3523 length:729 start_codon:yes stop_codon:yes gene_type:complete
MKKVFITGSSVGIGYDIAKKFLQTKKYIIYLNSRSKNSNIRKILKNKNINYCECDVEDIEDVKKIAKNFKNNSLSAIICNVGGGKYNRNGYETIDDFLRAFSKNFLSAINVIYSLKTKLKKNSKIICISSIASKNVCDSPLAYSTAKSALNSFIKGFGKNFKMNKICITGILPGHVMHKNSVWRKKLKNDAKLVKSMLEENIPIGNFIKSTEIADLAYLITELDGNSLNGSLIDAEGGITTK